MSAVVYAEEGMMVLSVLVAGVCAEEVLATPSVMVAKSDVVVLLLPAEASTGGRIQSPSEIVSVVASLGCWRRGACCWGA